MTDSVDRHRIAVSPLTGNAYLYRHGKNPDEALSKRRCESELYKAIVDLAFFGMKPEEAPEGIMIGVTNGTEEYEIIVRKKAPAPVSNDQEAA